MLVIGLTGPSGAGKSEVAELLHRHGLPVIDADAVYHGLLLPPSPCLEELCARFGTEILNSDGTLNRPLLGHIVFNDAASLTDLNRITHRYVMEEIRAVLGGYRRLGERAVVLDAPQLFEAHADALCDTVVAVLADRQVRLSRIMARDGITAERAAERIDAQKSDAFFRENAAHVIENNGDISEIERAVRALLTRLEVISP